MAIPRAAISSSACTTAKVARDAVKNGYFATRSHATDPLLCAAGTESLNIVEEEGMAGKAALIERRIKSAFQKMAKEFELIGDIRGRGVLLGIEFVSDREKKTSANDATRKIFDYCFSKGLIFQIRGTRGLQNVIRLVPPMTTTKRELDRALSILYDSIKNASRLKRRS